LGYIYNQRVKGFNSDSKSFIPSGAKIGMRYEGLGMPFLQITSMISKMIYCCNMDLARIPPLDFEGKDSPLISGLTIKSSFSFLPESSDKTISALIEKFKSLDKKGS